MATQRWGAAAALAVVIACTPPARERAAIAPPGGSADEGAATAACRGATLPFDETAPEGPFASLEAICVHAAARSGNDAPRTCREDVSAAVHARPRLDPAAPIGDARIVAHDLGGDFVHCNLALRTSAGWWVFLGPVCENSMNDEAYAFTVHELSSRASAGGQLVVARFTVTERMGEMGGEDTHKGSFMAICGIPRGAEAPACATVPEAMSKGNRIVDFETELEDDAVRFGGPIAREGLPWVTLTNHRHSIDYLEALDPPARFCLPDFR